MPLEQRFQPCQLKKGGSHKCRRCEPLRGPGACSLRKILRYVPLRYSFLYFEIIVNGNNKATIITGSWFDAKTVKMVENPQKMAKKHAKRLVKQRNGRVSTTGRNLIK